MVTILLLIILILVLIISLIHLHQIQIMERKKLYQIPGPPLYPFVGNLLQMVGPPEHVWKYFRQMARKYYPIYKMWNGHIGSVGMISPKDIQIVLSSRKHLRKTKVYEWLQPWLGTGLLTSTGNKWVSRRKLLTPAFHFNILEGFVEIFSEKCNTLVKKLDKECSASCTNIIPFITEFTLHSICETAMGTKLDEENDKTKKYIESIYKMGELILYRVIHPWLFFKTIYRLSSKNKEEKQLVHILHNFSMSIIKERTEQFKKFLEKHANKDEFFNSKKRLALLDMLISAQQENMCIDDEGIREEVDTFMFEGHDTTTASICFTLLLLANHPTIQDKVVQELQEVFKETEMKTTIQDLQKLRYLEMVIKESLRIYPSVPLITRILEEDVVTPSGYKIPAKTFIHIHIYDLHHNPDIYPEPSKFDPERFSQENSQKRHPYAYIPFSAGPRNCIGQRYAMLELKNIISAILRRYILKPVDTEFDMQLITHLVLKTKTEIRIKFIKR